MTAGQNIKQAAENTSKVADHVVDAVEDKVNTVTDAVEDALRTAADKIHAAASQPASIPAAK
jgi:replicative DNA helicase